MCSRCMDMDCGLWAMKMLSGVYSPQAHVGERVMSAFTFIFVSKHVCESTSHSKGFLSVLTQKLCLHFHFPSLAGLSPNLPWQLLSTRQACPPTTLHPMLLQYALDASQLVCRLCGAGRLLETDARATVGPCFEDLCHRSALGPRCDLYCWGIVLKKEQGSSAALSSVQVPTAVAVEEVPVFTILSVKVKSDNSWRINSTDINGEHGPSFSRLEVQH